MEHQRDRSEGWQYAKLSGHQNEELIRALFDSPHYCQEFATCIGLKGSIRKAYVGGLNETDVKGVLGHKTKSKTDLVLEADNDGAIKISIKKSADGQVYLISVERFIEGYEKQFKETIPHEVKEALRIYFYGHPQIEEILRNCNISKNLTKRAQDLQKKKHRLVWDALRQYNEVYAEAMLQWFKDKIGNITLYAFSRGLACDCNDWAEYIWYKDLVGRNQFDDLLNIVDLVNAVIKNKDMVKPGRVNNGSTIQLPFGSVQWHQGQMQFRHSREKILEILNKN